MAFFIHSVDDGHVPPNECLRGGDFPHSAGAALTLFGGALQAATGATKPEYICLQEGNSSAAAVPVMRVASDVIYETTLFAAGDSLNLGDKVTIAASAAHVTATTTNGVAEIVGFPDGTKASGDRVLVRFP